MSEAKNTQIKELLGSLREALDAAHKEEAGILKDIDALEREARDHGMQQEMQQLLNAYTLIVNTGSVLTQVALDLLVPPTVFEQVHRPHSREDQAA